MLHEELLFDDQNGWLTAIGFGKNKNEQQASDVENLELAKKFRFKNPQTVELLQAAMDNPDQSRNLEQFLWQQAGMNNIFPKRAVSNPDRREKKVKEKIKTAEKRTFESRKRSVRISQGSVEQRTWLKNNYTNENEEMICQICKSEMPFRKRDGEYYFEAVEIAGAEYFDVEHEAQYLALCPVCSAMYREFVKNDEEATADIIDSLKYSDDPEIELTLGELNTTIQFVEAHLHDLKVILSDIEV